MRKTFKMIVSILRICSVQRLGHRARVRKLLLTCNTEEEHFRALLLWYNILHGNSSVVKNLTYYSIAQVSQNS